MPVTVSTELRQDPSTKIKAVAYEGTQKISTILVPKPLITDPDDAVVRVTSTAICGSDLHMYVGSLPGMQKGDVLGHEWMGIVEQVGPGVKNISKGDRVVACFDMGCGQCLYCNKQQFSCCDVTNPDPTGNQEALYGHRTAGIYGYSHLTGGHAGGQAEYARVPFADVNLLKVSPDTNEYPDSRVLFLSDILPTAWHANELGEVGKGDTVAIWGAGPVGILAAHCAFHRGAAAVVLIDNQEYRLEFARSKMPQVKTINFGVTKDVSKELKSMFPGGKTEPGGVGPDVGLECVGFHYSGSLLHKAQQAVGLEVDTPVVLNQMITSVRKAGRLSVIGVYAGTVNGLNIGAFMEKGLRMGAGQTPCQAYWKYLLSQIEAGNLHPEWVITHELPLDEAAHGYDIFSRKVDNCIKVVLRP